MRDRRPSSDVASSSNIGESELEFEKACKAAIEKLGLEKSLSVWSRAVRAISKPKGRPPKSQLENWEANLLNIYDHMACDPGPETLVRHLAEITYEFQPGVANSVEALEKRIRRLIKKRDSGTNKSRATGWSAVVSASSGTKSQT